MSEGTGAHASFAATSRSFARSLRSFGRTRASFAGALRKGAREGEKGGGTLAKGAPNKSVDGAQHPDRNAQFEHINAKAQDCVEQGIPVISVDTKKKELIGNFKNGGREWQPKGEPDLVDVHDFPSDAVGKAIPYGVYDVAASVAPARRPRWP
jgi:hypothetical protein